MKWMSFATFSKILLLNHISSVVTALPSAVRGSPISAQEASQAVPNHVSPIPELIIYIMGDDIGPGDLRFRLSEASIAKYEIRTPVIDQLRINSALYPNVLAAAVCGPSRASFLTGRPQTYSSWRGNSDAIKNYQVPYTLPRALSEIGWVPIISGKFGFGDCESTQSVMKFGFERSFYYATHIDAHYPFPEKLYTGCEQIRYENNIRTSRKKCLNNRCTSANDLQLNYVIEQIEQCVQTKQKCAVFYMPTYSHVGKYSGNVLSGYPIDSYETYPVGWGVDARGYAAMVTKFDFNIGAILDRVNSLGKQNNTLTFIFSDNGAECFYINGRPRCERKPFGSDGGRRGLKRSMYKGGIETPIIVNWPGTITAKSSSNYPWALHDLPLTTMDILQAPNSIKQKFKVPEQVIDGRPLSVAQMLLQGDTYAPVRNLIFSEYCEDGESSCTYAAINTSDWRNTLPKLVCEVPKCVQELYDIKADQSESNNLASLPGWQAVVTKMITARNANRIALL